jgi:NAD-dependent DNA ligase
MAGSVTSKTNYLITSTPYSVTSKNTIVRNLGISVITEKEFIEKFGKV